MAEGKGTYAGLAVPLHGNFEITGLSSSEDIMTLTATGGATGDFIVCQSSAGTEVFVVEDAGKMTVGGEGITITSGGLTVTAGGAVITAGNVTVTDGNLLMTSGSLTISAGSVTVTAGSITATAGDITAGGDVVVGDGAYLRFSSNSLTTAPTTGLTTGDVCVYGQASSYRIGFSHDGSSALWHVSLTDN